MGFDLSYATLEAVETIAEAKLAEGVTTFLPTTWTASREHKIAMAQAAAAYRQNQRFARTPFLHIEGPYLNPAQAGAQDIRYMRPPDVAEIRHLHEICPVGLISLAVEIEGAIPFIREMRQMGIVTSAAHSAATYAEFRAAKEAGLAHLTHYCNQMSGLHHREVGLVGAGLLDDTIMIELICDTVHLCPDMIRLAFKHRSCERLMLITDSIAAAHLGEGRYPLHDGEIIVKDGAARIPAGNLAGSIVTFDESLRNVVKATGLPLNELARTCSANQARSLGLKDRGSLKQGLLADLTLLTPDLKVAAVYVGGEKRFSA
jgi:N-acetylglucosamine-6-phosphate deacetylase